MHTHAHATNIISIEELANTTPVNPPTTNKKINPKAQYIGTSLHGLDEEKKKHDATTWLSTSTKNRSIKFNTPLAAANRPGE